MRSIRDGDIDMSKRYSLVSIRLDHNKTGKQSVDIGTIVGVIVHYDVYSRCTSLKPQMHHIITTDSMVTGEVDILDLATIEYIEYLESMTIAAISAEFIIHELGTLPEKSIAAYQMLDITVLLIECVVD